MLALLVSSIAKTTTSAMTIMPFLLIIQLLLWTAVYVVAAIALLELIDRDKR